MVDPSASAAARVKSDSDTTRAATRATPIFSSPILSRPLGSTVAWWAGRQGVGGETGGSRWQAGAVAALAALAGVRRSRAGRSPARARIAQLGRTPLPERRGKGALPGVRRLRGIQLRGADTERHHLTDAGAAGGPRLARRRGHHQRLHLRRDGQRHRGSGLCPRLRGCPSRYLLYGSGSGHGGGWRPYRGHHSGSPGLLDGGHGSPRRAGAASRASPRRGLRARPRGPLEGTGRGLDRGFRLLLDAEHEALDRGGGRDRHHERRAPTSSASSPW